METNQQQLMNAPHKATERQWAINRRRAENDDATDSVLLEVADRLAALESARPQPDVKECSVVAPNHTTLNDNPIGLPQLDLITAWMAEIWHEGTPVQISASDVHIAERAAQWGANQATCSRYPQLTSPPATDFCTMLRKEMALNDPKNDPNNFIHEFKLHTHPKASDNVIITTIFIGGRGALGIGWLPENMDDTEGVRPFSYTDDFWDRVVQEITIVQDNMKVANIQLPPYCSLTPRSLKDYAKDLNKFKEEVMTKNMSEHEKVKLKEQALAKLTWEEIQALGIEMS